MATPVVIADNGLGIPVTQTEQTETSRSATPMTIAENGRGIPVILVEANGLPVTIDNLPEED